MLRHCDSVRRSALGLALPAVVLLVATGCFPDAEGTPPNLDDAYIYYPVGVALTQPEGRYLLVVNSNFDLLFNSGSVVPLELAPIRQAIEECRALDPEVECISFLVPFEKDVRDERYQVVDYLLEEHAVRIGSYASSIAVTEGLAVVPVRADATLHFIDVNEVPEGSLGFERVLRCDWGEGADEAGPFQYCGSQRRVGGGLRERTNAAIGLPSDPFRVVPWRDPSDGTEYFLVSHMVGGQVSLFERRHDLLGIDLPRDCANGRSDDNDELDDLNDPGCQGSIVRLVDVEGSFSEGSTGLAVDPDGRFLVTSRFTSLLTAFRVNTPEETTGEGAAEIVPSKTISVDVASGGQNQRGLAISPDGTRAYIASRDPDSILVLDITHDEWGNYSDRFVDVIEIGEGPSIVRVYEDPRFDEGYLVYAVCFEEDRIFIIDPAINEVIRVITTRRGPYDLTFDAELQVGYLVNFLESTISVIDLNPDSNRFHTILTTLGRPKRPRTND